MPDFSIVSGNSATFVDTTPNGGFVLDFALLDNSLSVQINGVDLFIGGPGASPNELEFQTNGTEGQTIRFADGDLYGTNTPEIWQLSNADASPIFRLAVDPDGTIEIFGVKANNGPLVPLQLFNGMSVNTAAIAAAWNDTGVNTIVLDQEVTGPTNASGALVDIICFAAGTLIDTTKGPVRIEDLRIADRVLTYDQGDQPIRWIGSCSLSLAQLRTNPKLRPILIRADALGPGYPTHDLVVSPQHRVLAASPIVRRMFDRRDVLIPAHKLLPLDGVETLDDHPNGLTYWHLLFDDHQIIWSNGAPTESLFTGPEALKAVSPAGAAEIKALFPQLCEPGFQPSCASHIPQKGRMMRKLVQRHQANDKPVFAPH